MNSFTSAFDEGKKREHRRPASLPLFLPAWSVSFRQPQIERTLFHALLKLEAFTIQKDAVDQGDHRVHVVQDSLTEAELSITSRLA